jgi:hypothetical protein
MKYLTLITIMTVSLLAAAGCESGVADDGGAATEAPQTPTNRVAIPATVRNNLGITFAKVERREVANTIRVPGHFELEPLARHEYRKVLSGHVELLVEQFQKVEAGTLLYRFRSAMWPELQHEIIGGEQALASSKVEIEVAKSKLDETGRRLEVLRQRIAALAEAQFRQAELESQAADLEASIPRLESELRLAETKQSNARRTYRHALHRAAAAIGVAEGDLISEVTYDGQQVPRYTTIDWIDVTAAHAGTVELLGVTDGAFVEASKLVLSTVDLDRLRFRAQGLQSDLARYTHDLPARIVPPRSPGFDITESIDATLTIGLEAHPDERTVTLIATPAERRAWMRPGVSAFLEVVVEGDGKARLAIPRSSVARDGVHHILFRRDPKDPNQAIRLEADLGVDDGRWVVIRSGLKLGDEVVLDGVYELNLATSTGGTRQKGGHFHADGTFHGEDH